MSDSLIPVAQQDTLSAFIRWGPSGRRLLVCGRQHVKPRAHITSLNSARAACLVEVWRLFLKMCTWLTCLPLLK